MIILTLEAVAEIVGGELVRIEDADRTVSAISIDSRQAADGTLFVALRTEHADGHDYLADAVERGAVGTLCASDYAAGMTDPAAQLPAGTIVVDDPADALLGLGAWMRDTIDPTVVAITGSQGKTTTKDLIAIAAGAPSTIGSAKPLEVVAAPGSYNNELGVPLTCCMLTEESDVLVTEIGTRGIGHIAALTPIVRPDVVVVTAVGASHLELLGDVETVAIAKAELVESIDEAGVAILNADDPRAVAMASRSRGRVLTYGQAEDADWRAVAVRMDRLARPRFTAIAPDGAEVDVTLEVIGEHNVSNALAALAVAAECGVDLQAAAQALAKARVSPWRMQLFERSDGIVVLNDAYNANPASTAAALRTLARLEVDGRRWAVLGQMAELGATSAQEHAIVGRACAELGIYGLVVVGQDAQGIHDAAAEQGLGARGTLRLVADPDGALAFVRPRLQPGDAVLVKASRSVGLERLAAALAEETEGEGGNR